MLETRITSGECQTVNLGDRLGVIDPDGGITMSCIIDRVGPEVGAVWDFKTEEDDGTLVDRSEYMCWRIADLSWSDDFGGWLVPYGRMR